MLREQILSVLSLPLPIWGVWIFCKRFASLRFEKILVDQVLKCGQGAGIIVVGWGPNSQEWLL